MSTPDKLFIALDVPSAKEALALAEPLSELGVGFKIGMQLFYAEGPAMIERLKKFSGGPLFVDLKLHDIPNTVAGAVKSLVAGGADFLNVHCQGGPEMMRAARQAANEAGGPHVKVIGVTILTSMNKETVRDFLHVKDLSLAETVLHLATETKACGLDGVVCSAQEAKNLKAKLGKEFLLVTPGIRPANSNSSDDQSRIVTPAQAMADGADYLVVGRPVTAAADPLAAAREILLQMQGCTV